MVRLQAGAITIDHYLMSRLKLFCEKLSIEQRRDGPIAGKLGPDQSQFFRIRGQFNRGAFVVLKCRCNQLREPNGV